MSEMLQAIALVFRRRGGASMTATDFRHVASFDLKWFSPKEAGRLIEVALASGVLAEEEGRLKPLFDPHRVDTPLDYRPGPAAFEPPRDRLPTPETAAAHGATEPTLKETLAALSGTTPEDLAAAARVESERAQGLLGEETALLVAARRRGADVTAYL